MENKNFYSVEIGRKSRNGTLIDPIRFVCVSEKTEYEVHLHYKDKYSGFDIKVTAVMEIDKPKIEGKKLDDYDIQHQYERKLAALQKTTDRIEIGIDNRKLTGVSKELYSRLDAARGIVKTLEESLRSEIEKEVKEKHENVCTYAVLKSTFADSYEAKCEIHLKGKLIEIIK